MKKLCICAVPALILLVVLSYLSPVKYAVKSPEANNFIACKREKVTGYDWVIVDEKNNDKYTEFINIINDENLKTICEFQTLKSDNVFYIYGEFVGTGDEGERIFKLKSWDIRYPVKHSFPLFYRYICKLDTVL